MDTSRFARTEIFRSLGVLGHSEILRELQVERPAEQMTAILRFVVDDLGGSSVPDHRDRQAVRAWTHERLHKAALGARKWRADSERWLPLALKSTTVIAWSPFREFGNLLAVRCGEEAFGWAMRRLRREGFPAEWDIVIDLRDEFTAERLPEAVRTFDPMRGVGHETEWLGTIFYRYAVRALASDRTNRKQIELLQRLRTSEETPEDAVLRREERHLEIFLQRALSDLDATEQAALRLYFGLMGKEATLGDVGKRLDVSEYKARNVVVLGLAKLATALGVQGALDDVEFKYARLVFQEGMDADVAAERLNLYRPEIQKRIATRFRNALRTRTSPSRVSTIKSERISMHEPTFASRDAGLPPVAERGTGADPEEFQQWLREALSNLHDRPRLEVHEAGTRLCAQISDRWVSIETIRSLLTRQAIEDLETRNVPLDWLLAGPEPSERVDLPFDAALNSERLEKLRERQWVLAEALYDLCRDCAPSTLPKEAREHTVERILLTLIAVAQGLESELPTELRHRCAAEFLITRETDDEVRGRWLGADDEVSIDLKHLIQEQATTAGEIASDFGKTLADEITKGMLSGEFGLPGLPLATAATDRVTLAWQLPPALEWEPMSGSESSPGDGQGARN